MEILPFIWTVRKILISNIGKKLVKGIIMRNMCSVPFFRAVLLGCTFLIVTNSIAQTGMDWPQSMELGAHYPEIAADVTEMAGDHLFVLNTDLEIWDVSDIQDPVLLGETSLNGDSEDVLFFNDLLFVSLGAAGLQVVDVSDSGAPQCLDQYVLSSAISAMCLVSGSLAVLDDQWAIHLLDFSDPENLELISLTENVTTVGYGDSVMASVGDSFVVCNYQFYDSGSEVGIVVWDFSNVEQPVQTDNLSFPPPCWGVGLCTVGNQIFCSFEESWGPESTDYYLAGYWLDASGNLHSDNWRKPLTSNALQFVSGQLINVGPIPSSGLGNSMGFTVYDPSTGNRVFQMSAYSPVSITGLDERLSICSEAFGLRLWEGKLFSSVHTTGQIGNLGTGFGIGATRVSKKSSYIHDFFNPRYYTHYQLFNLQNSSSIQLVDDRTIYGSGGAGIRLLSEDWLIETSCSTEGINQSFNIISTQGGSSVLSNGGGDSYILFLNGNVLWHLSPGNGQLDSYFLDPDFGSIPVGNFNVKLGNNFYKNFQPLDDLLIFYSTNPEKVIHFYDISQPDQFTQLAAIPLPSDSIVSNMVSGETHLFYKVLNQVNAIDFTDPENPILLEDVCSGDFSIISDVDGNIITERIAQVGWRVWEWSGTELTLVSQMLPFDYSKFVWDGDFGYIGDQIEVHLYRWSNYDYEWIGRGTCPTTVGSLEIYDGKLYAGEYILPLYEDSFTPVTKLSIDIIPQQTGNRISCTNSDQIISVAVFSDNEIDATSLDPQTARFGPAEAHPLALHNGAPGQTLDINQDGRLDLHLEFSAGSSGIQCGNQYAVLSMTLPNGSTVSGIDHIQTVGDSDQQLNMDIQVSCSPNPFNPQVNITLSNPREQWSKAAIFDIRGRKISTLAEGVLASGENRLVWSGKDQQGQDVPSGTYFLRVESEKEIKTNKLLLVR